MQRPLLHDSKTAQGVMQSCSALCCITKSCSHAAPPLLHDQDSPGSHAVMQSCSAPCCMTESCSHAATLSLRQNKTQQSTFMKA
eukprot:995881-Amphidinium_carterae.1